MRYSILHRIQRLFVLVGFIALLGIAVMTARAAGVIGADAGGRAPLSFWARLFYRPQVALISGHAGNDSGAVCTDAAGNVTLTEADVNATVTQLVARQLRRAGAEVLVLDEYDERLRDLRVDALLSLHSDSCIAESGYKAAHRQNSPIAASEQRLLACIDQYYPPATGLAYHPNTVTHDMLGYYAFQRIDPDTPAVILEMGFLGGDQQLLVDAPQRVAAGVARGILCFLHDELPAAEATQVVTQE